MVTQLCNKKLSPAPVTRWKDELELPALSLARWRCYSALDPGRSKCKSSLEEHPQFGLSGWPNMKVNQIQAHNQRPNSQRKNYHECEFTETKTTNFSPTQRLQRMKSSDIDLLCIKCLKKWTIQSQKWKSSERLLKMTRQILDTLEMKNTVVGKKKLWWFSQRSPGKPGSSKQGGFTHILASRGEAAKNRVSTTSWEVKSQRNLYHWTCV